MKNKALWDIDTQNDIILKSSPFAVPGAYKIRESFGEAIKYYEDKDFYIMGVVDAHTGFESVPGTRDENLPLHCVKGTEGQLKIKETQGDILFVSDQPYAPEALDLIIAEAKKGKRIYFEKQTQSCKTNPNIEYIFKQLKIDHVYFIGVLTNVCVKFSDEYFKSIGIKTYLVENAIMGKDFPGDLVTDSIETMTSSGTKIVRYKK